ncbi:MAG: hypothetical protein ACJZ64_03880 [Opitutales bacterium]
MKIILSILILFLGTLYAEEGSNPKKSSDHRISYYKNGEIHVNYVGYPDSEPLTKGHWDFKPSWSKTGNKLVFFRRYVNAPEVWNWKTAICIINADGTDFIKLPTRRKLILIRPGHGMEPIDRFGTAGIRVAKGTM